MSLLFRSTMLQSARPMWMAMTSATRRNMSSHKKETDEEFDERWRAYFERKNIDGRKQKLQFNLLNDFF